MTEKESKKGKKRTGKLLSSFVALTIVLSVLAVSVVPVIAPDPVPPPPDPASITATANPETIVANGVATSTITALARKEDGTPCGSGEGPITFKIIGGPADVVLVGADELKQVYAYTNAEGKANATLRAGTTDGTATVKAFYSGQAGVISDTADVRLYTDYEPDLIVTEITPNCDFLFANESNDINATIKNVGTAAAGAFSVNFTVDAFSDVVSVSGLDVGASKEVTITDPTLRTAGDLVTINVTIDLGGKSNSTTETVMNNGYKSKSFAGLPSLVLHEHGKFNGSIVYTVGNSSKVELEPANTTTTGFDITIPGGATVRTARLYVYWYDSWYSVVHGDADLEVTFDGHSFTTPGASYTDGKGFGSYNYPKGTYAYDVTSDVSGTGTYTATIENTAANTNTVLTGQLLLVVYEDTNESEMEYWITEGCDLLKADSNYCVSPEEAIANVTFEGTIDVTNKSARLITVVAQGNELGTDLSFNDKIWEDVWQVPDGNSKIDIDDRSVTSWLNPSDNVADFRDTGTMGMQASNAILVVEHVVEYNFTIDFVTGYNMITLPVNDTSVTNASTLIDKIGANCTEVLKWDKGTQAWKSYYPDDPPIFDFDIVGGEGCFVSMSGPKTVVFRGMGWESPFTISLVTGYNMIGIPVNDTSVTNASTLIAQIGANCTEVLKWDKDTQAWKSYYPGDPPIFDFDIIVCEEGYFVNMVGPADVTFVGGQCQD